MRLIKNIFGSIGEFFKGLAVVLTYEDDPELWDDPGKRARVRRRWRKEGGS